MFRTLEEAKLHGLQIQILGKDYLGAKFVFIFRGYILKQNSLDEMKGV